MWRIHADCKSSSCLVLLTSTWFPEWQMPRLLSGAENDIKIISSVTSLVFVSKEKLFQSFQFQHFRINAVAPSIKTKKRAL